MTKPIFVVHGLPYTRRSGGVRALHMLAKMLNDKGEYVVMAPSKSYYELGPIGSFNGPIILIEPEVAGNQCPDASLTVRWLLNLPGKANKDRSATWGEYDLLFHFEDRFKYKDSQSLFVPHIDESIFHNKENPADMCRTVECFYAFKAYSGKPLPINENWIDVSPVRGVLGIGNWETMAALFRRTKVLHTMEETATSIEAALCGADIHYITSDYMPVAPDIKDHVLYYKKLKEKSVEDVDNLVNLCYKRTGLNAVAA